MEPLTEMHLLLREHGWEPEIERDNGRMEAPRSQRIGDLHWPGFIIDVECKNRVPPAR